MIFFDFFLLLLILFLSRTAGTDSLLVLTLLAGHMDLNGTYNVASRNGVSLKDLFV